MILTIAGRELRSLFLSPLAWAILGVVMFIMAWMFLSILDAYLGFQDQLAMIDQPPGVTEIIAGQLLANTAVVMLLVSPLLTMRLISGLEDACKAESRPALPFLAHRSCDSSSA